MARRARPREDAAPAHAGQLVIPVENWKPEMLLKRLDSNQQGMSSWWRSVQTKYRLAVVNASRQIGKSFWACVLMTMFAYENPGAQIKYGAKTQKHVRKVIRPHLRSIFRDIPKELQPTWVAEDGEYVFKNGSTITVAGCDREYAETLVGQHAHLFIIDEGGSIRDLAYVVRDIAMPQTLNTKGRLIIFSTPARSPGHHFKMFCEEAKKHGTYIERDIFHNPRISNQEIRDACELAGGPNSTTWQREYLVRHVTEESAAVLPDATSARLRRISITDANLRATRSAFVDSYVVLAPAWNPNFTGVLWAHFDARKNRLVVEDELMMRTLDTQDLVLELGDRITKLWGEHEQVYRMVAANAEDELLGEMAEWNFHFSDSGVKDFDTSNQKLRHSITHRRGVPLYIHERCDDLRRQLENAVWSGTRKNRKEIERSELDGFYPLLHAAVALRESVNVTHDPHPVSLGSRFRAPHREPSKAGMALKRIAGLL